MASLELYEATEESFEVIKDLAEQMACNPHFKAEEVGVFNQMVAALRGQLDHMIGPTYYMGGEDSLQSYKSNLDHMAVLMRKLISQAEKSR